MLEQDYLMRIFLQFAEILRRSWFKARDEHDPKAAADMLENAVGDAVDIDGATLLSLAPESMAAILQVSGTDPRVTEYVARSLMLARTPLPTCGLGRRVPWPMPTGSSCPTTRPRWRACWTTSRSLPSSTSPRPTTLARPPSRHPRAQPSDAGSASAPQASRILAGPFGRPPSRRPALRAVRRRHPQHLAEP